MWYYWGEGGGGGGDKSYEADGGGKRAMKRQIKLFSHFDNFLLTSSYSTIVLS